MFHEHSSVTNKNILHVPDLEAKNIRFYLNFSAKNMGKKRGLFVAEREKFLL